MRACEIRIVKLDFYGSPCKKSSVRKNVKSEYYNPKNTFNARFGISVHCDSMVHIQGLL